jgi:hypothetical protein
MRDWNYPSEFPRPREVTRRCWAPIQRVKGQRASQASANAVDAGDVGLPYTDPGVGVFLKIPSSQLDFRWCLKCALAISAASRASLIVPCVVLAGLSLEGKQSSSLWLLHPFARTG